MRPFATPHIRRIQRSQFASKVPLQRTLWDGGEPGKMGGLSSEACAARTGSRISPTHTEARASLIRGHLFDRERARVLSDNLVNYCGSLIREELIGRAIRRIAGTATRALYRHR